MRILSGLMAALLVLPLSVLAQDVDLKAQSVGARSWTHSDGRKIKAGILDATKETVSLRLANGKRGDIALSKLSDEDRAYVATWLKNNAAPEGFGSPEVTIEIVTPKGEMKYDKPTISVYPGKKVKLVLRNEDDMHHNLLITKPGKGNALKVAMKAWELGADGFAKNWIPEHADLLFASNMADPQATATLYFTAPKKTGKYPYVCSIPGHAQVMNGVMNVTKEVNPLSELTFTVYKGGWERLPVWDQLKPSATDHVASGKFDLSVTKEKDNFGVVFDGKIEAPADGDYQFTTSSDDGSRLLINGKLVVDNDGIHGVTAKSGKVKLSKGLHDIQVQYFEKGGGEELYVGWKPPGSKKELTLSKSAKKGGGGAAKTGYPLVAETEARIYRNFIEGAGPRAIGVGYPNGLSLAFDANNMRIAMIWRGDYIDAARHWNGRGQGFQPPSGDDIAKASPAGVPFAVLKGADAVWPEELARKDNAEQPKTGYVFKGYQLGGDARIPSFRYMLDGLAIADTPTPFGGADSADAGFERSFKFIGDLPAGLHFRAAVDASIEVEGETFRIGDSLIMSFKGAKPIIREAAGIKELLVPVTADTLTQTIKWQ